MERPTLMLNSVNDTSILIVRFDFYNYKMFYFISQLFSCRIIQPINKLLDQSQRDATSAPIQLKNSTLKLML